LEKITLGNLENLLFLDEKYILSQDQQKRVVESYEFLSSFSREKVIYGINTGFGPMAQYVISDEELNQLQYNLIRSHSNGIGESLPPKYVKAAMISRLHTLALGFSGVSFELTKTLETFINKDILPVIPVHGGVGASGDLVQLAHIALALIGEGYVSYNEETYETKELLEKLNISPAKLKLRDGLALINGTSCMSGIAAINLIYSGELIDWAILASSVMNELTASYDDSFSAELNESKIHKGQQNVAAKMRTHLVDGNVLKKRNDHLFNGDHIKGKEYFSEKVQEYYSLRCVPQIIGPILDAWNNATKVLENEFNSANDNPIICNKSKNVYHGGNFHGDYISYEMDKLKIGITKLSVLMERQLNYLMNAKLNDKFPPFLNRGKLGLNFGLQGMQFTAVSTTAENQTLSNPMSVHSISNNGDNQDIVSMGTNSALLTKKVIDNSYDVLSIHLVAIAQAMDISDNFDQFSSAAKDLYKFVRSEVPELIEDVSLNKNLEQLKKRLLMKEK
jgi:histidine ammonia-lyase